MSGERPPTPAPASTLDGETLLTGSDLIPSTLARPLPQLFVIARRDAVDHPGSRHRLDGLDTVELGRGSGDAPRRDGATLRLALPDRRLSGRHARLVRVDDRWHVEDLGSTNGTGLDGRPVTRAPLTDGAVLELGRCVLMFRDAVPVDARTPLDQPEVELTGVTPAWRTFHDPLSATWRTLARSAGRLRVLVTGPTGAGKEVAARALHALSGRDGPFIGVNCAGLPPDLLAAELFGHRAGAFSGARAARPGYLRAADGGTLFLDEIDSLPLPAQAALLRPLAERAVTPVGGERPAPFDAFVICATNRDLTGAVEAGEFREDLMARLAEQTLALPPLDARREDLGLLVRALLPPGPPPRLDRAAARRLFGERWPRNVRALDAALRAGCAAAADGTLLGADLPPPPRAPTASAPPEPPPVDPDAAERVRLIAALRASGGNAKAAAARLGVARSTLYRRLEKLGIDPERHR